MSPKIIGFTATDKEGLKVMNMKTYIKMLVIWFKLFINIFIITITIDSMQN